MLHPVITLTRVVTMAHPTLKLLYGEYQNSLALMQPSISVLLVSSSRNTMTLSYQEYIVRTVHTVN